ncbi:hypothetical protein LTR36_003535 [Oleoguttula mirabilis]|uniref:Uncharacterized protein n=1 Tax=Oleoguttula mirabilis TaxID=1507867 RepID=A0AAV9JK71_9PEZI|nr:hypothetical protein LTR36_003535 [Oleoguttula mirabilis]
MGKNKKTTGSNSNPSQPKSDAKNKDEISPYGPAKASKKRPEQDAGGSATEDESWKPNWKVPSMNLSNAPDGWKDAVEPGLREAEEQNPEIDSWLRGTEPHKSHSDPDEQQKILTLMACVEGGKPLPSGSSWHFRKDGSGKRRDKKEWKTIEK